MSNGKPRLKLNLLRDSGEFTQEGAFMCENIWKLAQQVPVLWEQLLVCAIAQEQPPHFCARGGTKGLSSPGRSPGKDSIWGVLSPDPFSAVAAAEQLLGCVRFGFQPCKQPGVMDVGAGGVWRMDGGQVQTLLLLTYGRFATYSFSALYNFSLDLMDTPCRGHLAHQQQ